MNKWASCLAVGTICVSVLGGCGGVQQGNAATSILTEEEAKQALRQLPYRYRFRPVDLPEGAEAAIAGTAFGPYKTALNFGVAFGRSVQGVPVSRVGTAESYGYRETFLFTDDLQIFNARGKKIVNPRFRSIRQWHTAGRMEVEMTEELCKAATDEPCHP